MSGEIGDFIGVVASDLLRQEMEIIEGWVEEATQAGDRGVLVVLGPLTRELMGEVVTYGRTLRGGPQTLVPYGQIYVIDEAKVSLEILKSRNPHHLR